MEYLLQEQDLQSLSDGSLASLRSVLDLAWHSELSSEARPAIHQFRDQLSAEHGRRLWA